MSLREKILSEQAQNEAEQVSLRAKLEQEKTRAEEEGKVQQLRADIILREKQKEALDKAISAIETGYTAGAANIESYKKGKGDVVSGEETLKRADEVVEQLLRDFPDAFGAKGIKNKQELLGATEFQNEREILDYKGAEVAVGAAKESKKTAGGSLRADVGTLRASKKEVTEAAPDLELSLASFSKGKRADSLRRLHEYSAAISQELEILRLQTPEGQKAAKEKFSANFEERIKSKKFFTLGSPGYSVGLVKPEDIVAAQKYGEQMVSGTIREQVAAKLKTEVDKEKEKVGIPEARQELEALKRLPEKHEALVRRVEVLKQKRETVIQALRAKESVLGSRIRYYFGHEPEYEFGALLKKDFARAWLLYTEKDVMFRQFYPSQSSWSRDERVAEGGVPTVLGNFLENKTEVVRMLREKERFGGRGSIVTRELFDPNLFEQDIVNYEAFLSTFEDIVNNQPELIAAGHPARSDSDVLHEKLGYKTADEKPFLPLNIKSRMVGEGLRAGKSFADIESGIKQAEIPFDEASAERAEFLNQLIDKEWSEQELKVFEKTHPSAPQLESNSKQLEARKIAAKELAQSLLGAEELLMNGPTENRDFYNKVRLRVRTQPGSISLDIIDLDSESLRKNVETAEKKLQKIRHNIEVNKKTKRPFFGAKKLELELEALQASEMAASKEFDTAEVSYKMSETLKGLLGNNVYPMTRALQSARFDVPNNSSFSVRGFLDMIRNKIGEASTAFLSPEESQILEAHSRLQRSFLEKKTELDRARGDISDGVVSKFREVGWKESR